MKNVFLLASLLLAIVSCQTTQVSQRESDFNKNWKFSLDSVSNAYASDLDDATWRVC